MDNKRDIERTLDKIAHGVIAGGLAIALTAGAAVALPQIAHADEASLIASLAAGETAIDVADINRPYRYNDESFCQYVVNLPGVNPCVSRNSQVATREVDGEKMAVAFYPRYDYPGDIASRTTRYRAEVNRIAGEAMGQPNDYAQLKYAYDALMSRVDYCWDAANMGNVPVDQRGVYDRHSTPASALLDGSSVCSGYAAALTDIFRAMGYESWTCSNTNHAWTCIRLGDGQVFSCDPTKDDASGDYSRFMVNVATGNLWRPQYDAPAPSKPVEARESDSKPESAPAPVQEQNTPAETATRLPMTTPEPEPAPEPIPDRVEIKAGRVPVYNDGMTPANESIYSPITKGYYTTYQYESATTLYAPATVLPSIEGKPNIEIAR